MTFKIEEEYMRLIAAVDKNWGIGNKGDLLFRISSDLKRFKQLTTGGVVICGRKTVQTFPGGKPLKNRINLIMSRQNDLSIEGAAVCNSQEQLFAEIRKLIDQGYTQDQFYVIGGTSVYDLLLEYCDMAIITYVDAIRPADSHLINLDEIADWKLIDSEEPAKEAELTYEYRTYENKRAKAMP